MMFFCSLGLGITRQNLTIIGVLLFARVVTGSLFYYLPVERAKSGATAVL